MVVDASVMIAWLLNEPHLAPGEDIYQLMADRTITVPAHWPVEIGNALAVNLRKGRIRRTDLEKIGGQVSALHVVVAPAPTLPGINELVQFAADNGLTAYDAAYVQLAHQSDLALATLDAEMRRAAARLNIPLLPAAAP